MYPDRQHYSIEYSDLAVDFINKLLIKNRDKRLGALNDAAEVLAHPWFANVDV